MAAPINLNKLDIPMLEQTMFGSDMKRWLTTTTDKVNSSFTTLNQTLQNLLVLNTADIGGAGAGPINVTVTGLTTSGFVNVNLLSSSNPVTIANVTPGTNQFSVTFSGDPGASAIISYMAFSSKPQ